MWAYTHIYLGYLAYSLSTLLSLAVFPLPTDQATSLFSLSLPHTYRSLDRYRLTDSAVCYHSHYLIARSLFHIYCGALQQRTILFLHSITLKQVQMRSCWAAVFLHWVQLHVA